MKLSQTALQAVYTVEVQNVLTAVAQNSAREVLGGTTPGTLTDSSTGSAGASLSPVVTPPTKGVANGSNLSPRAAFNTAIGKTNNAVAVIGKFLNDNVLTPLGHTTVTLNDGTIATPGTIPAQDKALAATDGTSSTAMLRSEAVAAISNQRNNLATLVKAYNMAAISLGIVTLTDGVGGKADPTLTLADNVTAGTAVATTAGMDLALDTEVDAALLAMANDIATLAAKISTVLLASGTLSARVPILLVQ
jgi:hypothetical protein